MLEYTHLFMWTCRKYSSKNITSISSTKTETQFIPLVKQKRTKIDLFSASFVFKITFVFVSCILMTLWHFPCSITANDQKQVEMFSLFAPRCTRIKKHTLHPCIYFNEAKLFDEIQQLTCALRQQMFLLTCLYFRCLDCFSLNAFIASLHISCTTLEMIYDIKRITKCVPTSITIFSPQRVSRLCNKIKFVFCHVAS